LDYGEDAGVLLNSVIYIVSVPPICRSQYTFCEKSHRFVPFFTELNKISCFLLAVDQLAIDRAVYFVVSSMNIFGSVLLLLAF